LSLNHRGPDDKGCFFDQDIGVSFGHTRLSIIDLSNHASQPMVDQSGRYVLVFNGEVYNYKDLREELKNAGYVFTTDSDTEVVLYSYIAWGDECVKRFRGMFAFCVYDKQRQICFLARDRFGIKPLIYSFVDEQFVFASELKPLLEFKLVARKVSLESVDDVMRFGAVCQPRTIIEDAYQLEPGHVMVVSVEDLQFTKTRYYDLVSESKKRKAQCSYEEAVHAVREELEVATRYHMVADVEVGAFLSGGVDSTAAVALMQQYASKPVSTFTVGFSKDEGVVDETTLAEHTAALLGTKHQTIKVSDQYIDDIFDEFIEGLDQPSIDGINTFIVSRETSKSVKVAISGLGGDEIFAGYSHFLMLPKYVQGGSSMIGRIIRAVHNIRPNRVTRKFAYRGLPIEQALTMQRTLRGTGKLLARREENSHLSDVDEELTEIQRISKAEIEGYMLNTLLRDSDALSMSNSLELRPVLLDHNLFELAFGLDDEFKVRHGRFKSVFADAVKDLIPEEVITRGKTGFEMPFVSWMNGILNHRFASAIQQPIAKELFDARYLRRLNSRISSRSLKRNDWPTLILMSWLVKYGVSL